MPSALAAFSAPSGVSSAPSFAASCGLIAAHAGSGGTEQAAAQSRAVLRIVMSLRMQTRGTSERHLDARRREIAIVEIVAAARAAELASTPSPAPTFARRFAATPSVRP